MMDTCFRLVLIDAYSGVLKTWHITTDTSGCENSTNIAKPIGAASLIDEIRDEAIKAAERQ